MKTVIRAIRERFHPLFHLRRSALGRFLIRLVDRPGWLSIPGVKFPVRGQLLTHGLTYAAIGSQEVGPEALTRVCLRHFKSASFWDIGSNIGYYAWLAKSENPEIELVIIEPLPANAALIRGTLDRNRFAATLLVAGASDHPGSGILRADHLSGSTSTLENAGPTFEERYAGVHAEPLEVPLVTIDEIRDSHGPIGFMKIDVEGHEGAVIGGAQAAICRDQPILFIECCHPGHSCLDFLTLQGYRVVDADHLSVECSDGASNFFCFPARFADSVETVLEISRNQLR